MSESGTMHPGVTASGTATATSPIVQNGDSASNGTKIGNAPSTTAPSSGYYVSVKANAPETNLNLERTDTSEGFVGSSGQFSGTATVNASTGSNYYVTIPTGSCTVEASGNPTATATAGSANVSVEGMKTTVTNTGYKLHADATGGTAQATTPTISDTHEAGYIPTKAKTTVIAAKDTGAVTGTPQSVDQYVVAATVRTTAVDGETYSETRDNGSELIVPSGGALYINEGYIKNTKITLDEMLGGKADTAAIADNKVAAGYIVYDADGVKHTGSMQDATCTFSGGTTSASATAGTATATMDSSTITDGKSETATAHYIKVDASATGGDASASISDVLHTRTEGYVTAVNDANAVAGSSKEAKGETKTVSSTVYLKDAGVSIVKDTNIAPTVAISHKQTGIKTSTTATGYSCVVSATKTAGKATAHIAKTAGYLTNGNTSAVDVTGAEPDVTGTGTVYFKTTSVTPTISGTLGGGGVSGYNAPVMSAASSTAPQLVITGSTSGGETDCVLSSVGEDAKGYINYYTGGYSIVS